jgi:hypothetical protein
MGTIASVLPPTIHTSAFADQRGPRPARRGAALGLRIGAPIVALLGTILLSNTALAATAINLGTAAQFAILAGDAITNVPTSVIDGAVGLTPTTGAAIDLTCAEVTGTIYTIDLAGPLCREVNPGLLTTAKNALTTAYNSAAGQSPDSTFAGADNQLGTQTLVAGVYRFTAASTANLVGNLTLDGDSDDVWIFQATSTLVTAANSSVSFIGGAQACNVFWQVGSAATLGANSDFAGTILAHDDISLGSNVTVDGRLLAGGQANHAGAVTLISDTITRSDCAAAPAPTDTPAPTATPTAAPAATPTAAPGATPTAAPAATPTAAPAATTAAPTVVPLGVSATQPNTSTGAIETQSRGPGNLGFVLVLIALALVMAILKAPKRADR